MKKFALYLALLLTLAMLTACGGGSSSDDGGRSVLGGVGANAPIVNGAVTITDINGNIMATDTTGANGAYTVFGGITASPFIVTISATPTSTFSNGYPFKGEIKGLFTSGDASESLMVTLPSTILYKIWDVMGRPTDITAARARTISFLQMLGMNPSAVADLWSTNPVSLDYEILNQQLVFLCGQDDASGASDILSRASALANAYMTVADPLDDDTGGSVAALIETYTGYTVDDDGGGDATNYAALLALDAIKNTVASNVKAGLTGTSAASSAADIDTVIAQVTTQNNAAATFQLYPGAITLGGAGGISNQNTTKVIAFGSGTTTYAVSIAAVKNDGTTATAGSLSISSVTGGLTHDGAATFNSGTTVTFTVPTSSTGTYAATVKYTETVSGTDRTLSTTFYFKVLGNNEVYATDATFSTGPQRILFTDATNTTKIGSGSLFTPGAGATQGQFASTAAGEFIAAFYLPDGMYFVDSNNRFWPNWDVTVTAGGAATQTAILPNTMTVKANKDLSYGEYTWTFRVFDVNRDELLDSASATSIVYGSGGANTIRQITNEDYDIGGTNYTRVTYGSSADSGRQIQFDGGTTGNQYITLDDKFEGAVQTWAQAAGDTTTNTYTAGDFYLNVKSANFDDYAGKKTFGFTSSGNQNHDVTASNFVWVGGSKWFTFDIDLSGATVNFYPDYGAGLSNIDKIRIGYENTSGTKSAGDVKSAGTTFTHE